jgi:hypothetical protein
MRVLTIFEGLVFTLFEAVFPFRFPRGVVENGKRKWELDGRRRGPGRYADGRQIKCR